MTEIFLDFESSLMEIMAFNASVSFYMFHGGTNFGFMNGANSRSDFPGGYLPDTTSYGNIFVLFL